MAQKVTLGGDRLGSGPKQQVELHDYQMSSFNLEQDFKSSLAPGILYPFIKMVATNHGTFDIDLDTFVRTLPTKGPLFGSFKLQVDLFSVPMRLYQGILHNNPLKIGMKMNQVYLPKLRLRTLDGKTAPIVKGSNFYNRQVNESSLIKYLGLSGYGTSDVYNTEEQVISRKINAIPHLAYYDIFKNYYSNKQEQYAYVIGPGNIVEDTNKVEKLEKWDQPRGSGEWQWVPITRFRVGAVSGVGKYRITLSRETPKGDVDIDITFQPSDVMNISSDLSEAEGYDYISNVEQIGNTITFEITEENEETIMADKEEGDTYAEVNLKYNGTEKVSTATIELKKFDLQNIDDMRNALLSSNVLGEEFIIAKKEGTLVPNWDEESGTDGTGLPYSLLIKRTPQGITYNAFEENGLLVKTYQSDLFNNWLDTEWIDGEEGIAALTAIDTNSGSFTMDSFVFAEKLYEVYNRIATGGGTYQDWQEAVYGEGAIRMCETPMYIGGMAAEIMFEEVISNSETKVDGDYQPLGSLGGKGTQVAKRGGNNIHVKCDEPSYIMGIASITPRIAYSQGNDWDLTELDTLDDLHKPGMDGIGFQDLIIEQMAWWNTKLDNGSIPNRQSAGKQTAWINYQTAVDKCFGDFAKTDGYAFMVLNRNYEQGENPRDVKDVTTYIDPAKYNYAFANADLAAQNFWVQIHSKVIARRKMGAQQIPNL